MMFVTTEERVSVAPHVPTAKEVGLGEFKAYSWYGIYAPPATPRPIIDRMAQAIDQALGDAAINRRFEEMGTPAMRGWTPKPTGLNLPRCASACAPRPMPRRWTPIHRPPGRPPCVFWHRVRPCCAKRPGPRRCPTS
jgi:hypothetical protein